MEDKNEFAKLMFGEKMLETIRRGIEKIDAQIINDLANDLKNKYDSLEQFQFIFEYILLELIEKKTCLHNLRDYITLSFETSRRGLASYSFPVVILTHIFNNIPFDDYNKLFEYVENKLDVWQETNFFEHCKDKLIRLCCNLKKCLPRSEVALYDRIEAFSRKLLSISENSSLTVGSELNIMDKQETKGDQHKLYFQFWSLEDFFRDPFQIKNDEIWKTFCDNTNALLLAFEEIELKDEEINKENLAHLPYSEYITNLTIFQSQLQDTNFRRYILVQFLITFHTLTTSLGSKPIQLKLDQLNFVHATLEKVYTLLLQTPNGDAFTKCIKNLLKTEDFWIQFNEDKCTDFKKYLPTTSMDQPIKKERNPRRHLGDILKEAHQNGKFELNDPELTRLWNLNSDNLEACKNRDFMPTLESFFGDAKQQLINDGESQLLEDATYSWSGLRLLAKRAHPCRGKHPAKGIHEYLKRVILNTSLNQKENLLKPIFDLLVPKLLEKWKILGEKLGFEVDDINFLSKRSIDDNDAVNTMLLIWIQESNILSKFEEIKDILIDLKLFEAVSLVNTAIEQFSTQLQ